MDAAIAVENLTKKYDTPEGPIEAVSDVSFELAKSDSVAILGPNGAGKSTLIKCILGLVSPTAGSVSVDGIDVSENRRQAAGKMSAMLEGARNAYWRMTVRENMRFFLFHQGLNPRRRKDRITRMIADFGLADKADEQVRNLSRGLQQRVGLLVTLVQETPIVFLDEPTLGLDVQSTRQLTERLRRISDGDRTVIMSSHNLDVVEDLCDRVLIVKDGSIIEDSRMSEIVTMANEPRYDLSIGGATTGIRGEIEDRFTVDQWRETTTGVSFTVSLAEETDLYDVIDVLQRADTRIESVTRHGGSLEDVFVALTGDGETSQRTRPELETEQ